MSTKYKMNVTAQTYEMFSNGLYKDKIKSIVREVCNNAHDIHIEKNISAPFEVFLPSKYTELCEKNTFIVRDYAVGIHPDMIEDVYITYFASTKENSEDEAGAHGLGSKSPFAYYDYDGCFYVTSYHEGTKTKYEFFRNDDKYPDYRIVEVSPTDEPSGLKVEMPNIKDSDIDQFNISAKIAFRHMTIQPIVHNKEQTIWENLFEEPTVLIEGDGYCIYVPNNKYEPYNSRLTARINTVCYDIEHESLNLPKYENDFLKSACGYICFTKKEVQAAPSREYIAYDKNSIKNLSERISWVISDIKKKIYEKVKNAKNLMEVHAIYHKYMRHSCIRNLFPNQMLFYRGSLIGGTAFTHNSYCKEVIFDSKKSTKCELSLRQYVNFFDQDIDFIFINDLKNEAKGRRNIISYCTENYHNKKYLVVVQPESRELEIFKKYGIEKFIYASSLPDIEVKRTVAVSKEFSDLEYPVAYVQNFAKDTRYQLMSCSKYKPEISFAKPQTEGDKQFTYLYAIVDSKVVLDFDMKEELKNRSIFESINNIAYNPNIRIIIVPKKFISEFREAYPNIEYVEHYFKRTFIDWYSNFDYKPYLEYDIFSETVKHFKNEQKTPIGSISLIEEIISCVPPELEQTPFFSYIHLIKNLSKNKPVFKNIHVVNNLCEYYNLPLVNYIYEKNKAVEENISILKEVNTRYPLLVFLQIDEYKMSSFYLNSSTSIYYNYHKKIIDYVLTIEKSEKKHENIDVFKDELPVLSEGESLF